MTINQLITELLEFYELSDLQKFDEISIEYHWNNSDAWEFLNQMTIGDYRQLQRTPNINDYIILYAYRQDMGDVSPYIRAP